MWVVTGTLRDEKASRLLTVESFNGRGKDLCERVTFFTCGLRMTFIIPVTSSHESGILRAGASGDF